MAITIPPFNPSSTILATDKISQTDDKLRTILSEAGQYIETQSQGAVNQLEQKVDDKLNQLAENPGTTYKPEVIDAMVGKMSNSKFLGEIIVPISTNMAFINPVSFAKITVSDGAVLKLI